MVTKLLLQWARDVRDELLAAGRIDPDELDRLLADEIEGVDSTRSPVRDLTELDDSTPGPTTPLERLLAEVPIARDFREAGAGRTWDRAKRYNPKVYGHPPVKIRGASQGTRDIELVDTIVLHTAGVSLHVDRALGVPCHALVAGDGQLVLCHELPAYLAAAHRANSYSVSLEISGVRTIGAHQIPAARAWTRYAAEELRRRHARAGVRRQIKVIPHYCATDKRPVDCDPEIWRAVGEWSIDELGLVVGDVVGTGRPIPRKWWTPGRPEAA